MGRGIQFGGFCLAIALSSIGAEQASAQPRGDKNFSVINYLGRFHGIGYSDGYHACPDGTRCGPNGSRLAAPSENVLFDTPSTIGYPSNPAPQPRMIQDRLLGFQQNNTPSLVEPTFPALQPSGRRPSVPAQPNISYPTYPTPEYVTPIPNSSLAPSIVPPGSSLGSPSDLNPRMFAPQAPLPAPVPAPAGPTGFNPLHHPAPSLQAPGTHSLLRQSNAPGFYGAY